MEPQSKAFETGARILQQGAPGDTAYIIVDGEVEVVLEGDGGDRRLGTLGKGQIFGEMCMIEPDTRCASIIATRPTVCFEMRYDGIDAIVADHPALAGDLLRSLVKRHRDLNRMLSHITVGKKTLSQRIAEALQAPNLPPVEGDREELEVQKRAKAEIAMMYWTMW